MSSIVDDLFRSALYESTPIDALLRRARASADLLDLKEMSQWAERELYSYGVKEDVPEYRLISGEVQAWSPFHGSWQQIIWEEPENRKQLSTWPNRDSISEIRDRADRTDQRAWLLPLGSLRLTGAMGRELTNIGLHVDRASFTNIVSALRSKILDFAVELKKAGVKGEGLSFTEPEKRKVHDSNLTINIGRIGHFTGTVGDLSGDATISSSVSSVRTTLDVEAVRAFAKQLLGIRELPETERDAIHEQAEKMIVELDSQSPRESRLRTMVHSIRTIAEGVAGNVAAAGILHLTKQLLGGAP